MYDKNILVSKVEEMFRELKEKSGDILTSFTSVDYASKLIVEMVSSETALRSKSLLIDVYAQLSKAVLDSPDFAGAERKNSFYEMNLRSEIMEKYQFDVTSLKSFQDGIQYKEINKIYASVAAAAGTVAVGGVLKYALVSTINFPIVVIIAGALLAFCGVYFKAVPIGNKAALESALKDFFAESKLEFISWFDEIERYFDKRVDDLVKSFFRTGGQNDRL